MQFVFSAAVLVIKWTQKIVYFQSKNSLRKALRKKKILKKIRKLNNLQENETRFKKMQMLWGSFFEKSKEMRNTILKVLGCCDEVPRLFGGTTENEKQVKELFKEGNAIFDSKKYEIEKNKSQEEYGEEYCYGFSSYYLSTRLGCRVNIRYRLYYTV